MRNIRCDSISLDKTYYTDEGYLVDHPIVTTCGVFEYKYKDGSTRRELRLPEYVFEEKSLESYKGKPIIITHSAREVDKDNVRMEQIGTIMSAGYRDGDNVRCEIIIHDVNSLKRCGLKELSLGYSLDADETPGVYNGEEYDCIQKNIEINHLALVSDARAGSTARLNIDGRDDDVQILKGGKKVMHKPNNGHQTNYDGDSTLSPEEMEAAIELYKTLKATTAQEPGEGADGEVGLPEAEPAAEKSPIEQVRENIGHRDSDTGMSPEDVISGQKADLETLLAEIDKLQAASDMNKDSAPEEKDSVVPPTDCNNDGDEPAKAVNMDSADIDRIFRERMDVCRMADRLNLDGVDGLPVMEGRKRIIKAVNPKMNLDGKSDAYISAAYDLAKESYSERKSTNDQRRQVMQAQVRNDAKEASVSDTARANMIARRKGGTN